MKYKLAKNFPFLVVFVILMLFSIKSTFDVIGDYNNIIKTEQELKDMCANDTTNSNSEYCSIVAQQTTNPDFLTIFSTTVLEKLNSMNYVFIIAILIPALIYICKFFKYNQLTNTVTREKYCTIIKKLFFNSYKAIFIIPLVMLIVFVICILYTQTLEVNYSLTSNYMMWLPSTLSRPFIFMILYILNLVIHSIIYVNISLCIARKQHNLFIAIILSFLTIIGIEAFLEIIIGTLLLDMLFNYDLSLIVNIINFFAFQDRYGFGTCMIVPSILMMISFIVLYVIYRSKEKLIIDCEKNEWEGEKL